MIVSWNWLKQYVPLDMPLEELERRLMMAGLNHEGTEEVGGDLAIDLEVTSNRPDCLGHIGIAREVAVLFGSELTIAGRAAAGGQDAGRQAGQGADRLPGPLPALHGPGGSRREDRAEPEVDGPAAGDGRHHADQQRGGHQQLRADGVRPAAAHVRLRQAQGRPRSSSAGRCRARRSRPSTTRPTCCGPRCA